MAGSATATTLGQAEFSTMASASTAVGRSRPQARKKVNDDAAYIGVDASVAGAGAKRVAQERAEGEPRVKRKRVDHALVQGAGIMSTANTKHSKPDGESTSSLLDFSSLPTAALYRYVTHYDLVPIINPSPLSVEDPPPPAALLEPGRRLSPAPSPVSTPALTTPANRPRRGRESKEASRRRSSRLLEEEMRAVPGQSPVLADVGDIQGMLATIVLKHFKETGVKEVDTLASFMCAVKARCDRERG